MLGKIWDFILQFLKNQPFWSAIQPFVILAVACGVTEYLAFEYVRLQYGVSVSPAFFLGSYISIRIVLVFAGIAAILVLFKVEPKRPQVTTPRRVFRFFRAHQRLIWYRATVVAAVVIAVIGGLYQTWPNRVSHIRIVFMDAPDELDPSGEFNKYGFAYLIYELNRRQKNWHFDVDYKVFNPQRLHPDRGKRYFRAGKDVFVGAEQWAQELAARFAQESPEEYAAIYGQPHSEGASIPLIGITSQSLGEVSFCGHRDSVSVISTTDRQCYDPLTTYEYLVYCVIQQSILIHLDVHGGGLPPDAFKPSGISHGGVFQFNPEKRAIKASILTAHLGPEEKALLFNRFGAEYATVCADLLSLDWLRSEPVRGNLKQYFAADRKARNNQAGRQSLEDLLELDEE